MSRRSFLAGCATCAGAMVIPMAGSVAVAAGPSKKRIRVIYSLHADIQPRPDWPNVGFDFTPVMQEMTAALSAGCPEIEILTHSEDRQGASVRSLLPTGYMTTTIEFGSFRKELLLHRGKAVANIIEDRACRTKLAVEPRGDFEKLFTQWDRFGWHRVTAKLTVVCDLTDKTIRRKIGFTLDDLLDEDWQGIQAGGQESWTQAIGRGCRNAGFEAILVPSARNRRGKNIVIFPNRLRRDSRLAVLASKDLPPLPSHWPN